MQDKNNARNHNTVLHSRQEMKDGNEDTLTRFTP